MNENNIENIANDVIEIYIQTNYCNIDSMSYIYCLYKDETIVYVGQSSRPIDRIKYHKQENVKEFDSFTFFPCDKDVINEVEASYIIRHKPKYNFSLPKNYNYVDTFDATIILKKMFPSFNENKINYVLSLYNSIVVGSYRYYDSWSFNTAKNLLKEHANE